MSAGEMFIAGRRPSTPGQNTQVLFNDGGVDGANANLTFDKANSVLSVNGSAVINTSGSPVVALTLRDAANPLLYFVVDNGKANASNARIYTANDIFYMSFMNSAAVAHDVFSAARDFTGDKATVLNVIIGNGLDKPNVIIQGNLTIQSVATDGRAALNVAGNVNVTSTLVVGGAATAALGTIEMNSTNPQIGWNVTTGAANTKRWNAYGGGNWTLRTLSDDGTSSNNAIDIARGANSITSLKFGNANDNPTYTFLGTGRVGYNVTPSAGYSNASLIIQRYGPASALTGVANGYYVQLGGNDYINGGLDYRLIGFGYSPAGAVSSPAYFGFEEMTSAGFTLGDLVFGTRTVTTDTQPTERVRIVSTGNVGINTTGPVSLLDVRNGWITSGDTGDTTGAVLLGSWRANGELLTTYGTRRSSGGPVIGYACRSNTQGTLDFWSTYSSAIGRSAIAVEDGKITFFTGASQTVANGSPLVMSEVMRIDNTPFVGISGNGSTVTGNSVVAAGRASIVLGSGTDAALVFQNTGAFCGGYVYSTNTEMRVWGSTLSQTTLYSGGALAVTLDTSQNVTAAKNMTAAQFQGINANVVVFSPSMYAFYGGV